MPSWLKVALRPRDGDLSLPSDRHSEGWFCNNYADYGERRGVKPAGARPTGTRSLVGDGFDCADTAGLPGWADAGETGTADSHAGYHQRHRPGESAGEQEPRLLEQKHAERVPEQGYAQDQADT